MEIKSFTKTDWYGFAGCEPFADGAEPLMACEEKYLLVADQNGIGCFFEMDPTEIPNADDCLNLDAPKIWNAAIARATLEALPVSSDARATHAALIALGFR